MSKKQITVSLKPEDIKRLKKIADIESCSLSTLCRQFIENRLMIVSRPDILRTAVIGKDGSIIN